MVNYEDFSKLELKVGKIVEAADHPNADRLYVLKVDVGGRVLQMVAGVKGSYSLEDLKGKQVAVLANLEPKPLRGVESHGMVLAAQSSQGTRIIVPENEVEVGSIIK